MIRFGLNNIAKNSQRQKTDKLISQLNIQVKIISNTNNQKST